MAPSATTPKHDDDTFVNVWFDKDQHERPDQSADGLYSQWVDRTSAKHSYPEVSVADAIRKLHPGHSLVMSSDFRLNLISFPGVVAIPLDADQLITNLTFVPLNSRAEGVPGVLVDQVEFGAFRLAWESFEFTLYLARWPVGFGGSKVQNFIVHDGPEAPARTLLLRAGIWADSLHNEIWVFNQGYWQKSHALWLEMQKADWKDVVLKDEFKKALQKDVYGFFESEEIYKQLAIPWKRGLILYGPPGNGKTISVKAIMKSCLDKGFAPLYVKSFQSYMGEEGSMAEVFGKARQISPSVIILEDLDSLINDRNRSFFLNQLDGLEGNDGLLLIGTTNHFEKLDPALSTRPSRFDRKYLFDDPDRDERVLYAKYWQNKLKDNKDVTFPDSLVDEVADGTKKFSFAYLKEAFVSALVTLALAPEDDKPTFADLLIKQIKSLRKQLDKTPHDNAFTSSPAFTRPLPTPQASLRPEQDTNGRDVRVLFDALADSLAKSDIYPARIFDASSATPPAARGGRDVRVLLDALSDSIAKSDIRPARVFDAYAPAPSAGSSDARNFRGLLDRIAAQHDRDVLGERFYRSDVLGAPVARPAPGVPAEYPSAADMRNPSGPRELGGNVDIW